MVDSTEPEEVWVYLDETSHEGWRGAGAMIVPGPMPQRAVADALAALAMDTDAKSEEVAKMDAKTLSRGYFHACDDSHNGHSYWMNAINEHFDGAFIYSIRKDDPREDAQAFFEHLSSSVAFKPTPT